MDRQYEGTKHKDVEILTGHTSNITVTKRTGMCGFDPELWKEEYPGLTKDYFTNIQELCQEKNIDEDKIKKEVLDLAFEVAEQLQSTGLEKWMEKMEAQSMEILREAELPCIPRSNNTKRG